jgi:hypothetical protein
MKPLLIVFSSILALVTLCACRQISPFVELENPEFPLGRYPFSLSKKLRDKYSVGNIVINPRMMRHGSIGKAPSSEGYGLTVFLHAPESNTVSCAIQKIKLAVNGKAYVYGEDLLHTPHSEWRLNGWQFRDSFYTCAISSENWLTPPGVDMTQARVDVSLLISVKDGNGDETEKQLDVFFLPNKRFFIE